MRRQRIDWGRWQTQRERFCIESDIPPASSGNIVRAGDIAMDVLRRSAFPAEPPWLQSLRSEWEGMVGKQIARHVRPGQWRNGVLVLLADSAVWLNEIKRYSQADILLKLQGKFGSGKVCALESKLDPVPHRA